MGIAEDFTRLTEDFASSYDERMAVLGGIKKNTSALLTSAQDLLKEFEKARNEMGTELRKVMEKDNIAMQNEVKKLLKGFASDHEAMAKAQKDTLFKGVAELRDDVNSMVDGFTKVRGEMARTLSSDLTKDKKRRANEVAKLLEGFRREQKALIGELKKANASWNRLVSEMARKRGAPVKITVKPKVAKPPKPKAEKPEVAVEKAPEALVAEETIENKVLSVVKDMPGVTLKEIGDTLGIHFVRIAGVAKNLVENGKIRKEDKEYYLEK